MFMSLVQLHKVSPAPLGFFFTFSPSHPRPYLAASCEGAYRGVEELYHIKVLYVMSFGAGATQCDNLCGRTLSELSGGAAWPTPGGAEGGWRGWAGRGGKGGEAICMGWLHQGSWFELVPFLSDGTVVTCSASQTATR